MFTQEYINIEYSYLTKVNEPEPLSWTSVAEEQGDLFTIQEFIDMCECGAWLDGTGCYAYQDKVSNIYLSPSDLLCGELRDDFTHVMWYNQ